jgi:hypothetical protein
MNLIDTENNRTPLSTRDLRTKESVNKLAELLGTQRLDNESWGGFLQRMKLQIPPGREHEFVEVALGVREALDKTPVNDEADPERNATKKKVAKADKTPKSGKEDGSEHGTGDSDLSD